MSIRMFLAALVVAVPVDPSPAGGGIFGRKSGRSEGEQVAILIATLRSSPDHRKRAAAAADLGKFDPKVSAEIVPALQEALSRDLSADVRAEAAESLGKVRPINPRIGYALEQSLANDGAMKVRLAARTALWQYRLHGYRSGAAPADTMAGSQTAEPPLASPVPQAPAEPMVQPTQPQQAAPKGRLLSRFRSPDPARPSTQAPTQTQAPMAAPPATPTPLPTQAGPQPTTQEPPLLPPAAAPSNPLPSPTPTPAAPLPGAPLPLPKGPPATPAPPVTSGGQGPQLNPPG